MSMGARCEGVWAREPQEQDSARALVNLVCVAKNSSPVVASLITQPSRSFLLPKSMIKRRFYKQEHGDKDVPSDSSSSSESELDADASVDTEEEEEDINNNVIESRTQHHPSSLSSGYETEDGSENEASIDSSGLLTNNDVTDLPLTSENQLHNNIKSDEDANANDAITSAVLDCVLKSKSVFKCKLCPRIVCLTEETLKAHLQSKRHGRSVKLLKEGRHKMMLDSDGEIEGETHQERHASTLALAQSNKNGSQDSKKNKGRQRQRQRKLLKKKEKGPDDDLMSKKTKRSDKKRRKSEV
ncbi:hypothetical protein LXL04_007039 [Taraxacum kok-saghyz]